MVDLDPSGQVTGKEPDRSRRQFLNYAFFRLDPAFRRLPWAERTEAASEFPVPKFGPHDLEPTKNKTVWQAPALNRG